jgi:hypothetical protein
MNKAIFAGVMIGAGLLAAPALASNNQLLLLSQEHFANRAIVSIEGSENRLAIVQEHFGGADGNVINASISGDLNGGSEGASFSAPVARLGLQPGRLQQSGYANLMNVDISGSSNLFAFAQSGSNNSISAAMRGTGNQAAVMQVGIGNHAHFSQTGVGNMISISQTAW